MRMIPAYDGESSILNTLTSYCLRNCKKSVYSFILYFKNKPTKNFQVITKHQNNEAFGKIIKGMLPETYASLDAPVIFYLTIYIFVGYCLKNTYVWK